MDALLTPDALASFLTLALLEIVLGVDNLIFISIVSQRLPRARQRSARRVGLLMALGTRILLLLGITWVIGLTAPIFQAFGEAWSWRDLVLLGGGLFLIAKGTTEIHGTVESGGSALETKGRTATAAFGVVITQIALLDIVFSLDSVITAVGMADEVAIMVAAVVAAIAVMVFAAEPVSAFVERHPTVRMLALSFLLLIGVALVADGLHFHIPKGYLYFAVAFAVLVESLNLWVARRRRRKLAEAGAAEAG